jgi:AraC family transcriptional regulator
VDYKCDSGPHDASYVELHESFAVSFVRKGSFGYRYRGATHDLVSGSVLLGHAGDEFECTHEHHHCGDECLSFHFTPEAIETIAGGKSAVDAWRMGYLPPLPETMVLGELAQTIADGRSDIGLDEIALTFASRFIEIAADNRRKPLRLAARDRLRAVEAASWIAEHSHLEIDHAFKFVSFSARVLTSAGRYAASILAAFASAQCRSFARRRSSTDHRNCDDGRFRRLVQLRANLPSRCWRIAAAVQSASRQDRKIFQERLAAR